MQDNKLINYSEETNNKITPSVLFFTLFYIFASGGTPVIVLRKTEQGEVEMEGRDSTLLALPHVEIIQSILQAAASFYSFIYYHTVIVNCLLFTSAGFSKLVLSNVTGGRALSI